MSISIGATRIKSPTVTGVLDVTISGFGTPKAAYFLISKSNNIGSFHYAAGYGIGATDGTREWVVGNAEVDNVGTSQITTFQRTNACVSAIRDVGGQYDAEAEFDSWITNGVRLNWTNVDDKTFVTVILFGGTDLSVYAGTQICENSWPYFQNIPFEPELVIGGGQYNQGSMGLVNQNFSQGICINTSDVTSFSTSQFRLNNSATTSVWASADSGIFNRYYTSSGTAYGTAVLEDFSSSGFYINSAVNLNSTRINYLALSFNGTVDLDLRTITTPTVTGNVSYTGIGFRPTSLFSLPHHLSNMNILTSGTQAQCIASAFSDENKVSLGHSTASRDKVGTSECASVTDGINSLKYDGRVDMNAEVYSYDSDGFTLNYDKIFVTTIKNWIVLSLNNGSTEENKILIPSWIFQAKGGLF